MSIKYDLKTGYPDLSLVPRGRLLEHIGALFDAERGMQYGGSLQGVLQTRDPIAGWLTRTMGAAVTPDQLIIIPGTLFAIDLICRTVAKPGDVVLVEEPTFFFAVNLLRMSGAEVVGVPMSDDGIDLAALESALKQYGGRVKLIYTIPSFHNPTGICAIAANRAEVARLAAQYDTLVLEDATYQLLYYGKLPPPPLKTFDPTGEHVVLAASVSKLLMPSLRLGWIWGSKAWIARFLAYKSDGATSALTSSVVAEFMRSGEMDGQLVHARALYQYKHDLMVATLREHAPAWLKWTPPQGGYFIWATLPDGLTGAQIEAAAAARGVAIMRGSESYAHPPHDQTIRLCFALLKDAELVEATKILCEVLKNLR
ncbi:MAG: PLP-dependent aminotransferase family protein [Chloroflexota bacterium]|nr:PLP-dependent aminotransferase family protein [Chloroflexota bacterium]